MFGPGVGAVVVQEKDVAAYRARGFVSLDEHKANVKKRVKAPVTKKMDERAD